jgi:hypothetical protein
MPYFFSHNNCAVYVQIRPGKYLKRPLAFTTAILWEKLSSSLPRCLLMQTFQINVSRRYESR